MAQRRGEKSIDGPTSSPSLSCSSAEWNFGPDVRQPWTSTPLQGGQTSPGLQAAPVDLDLSPLSPEKSTEPYPEPNSSLAEKSRPSATYAIRGQTTPPSSPPRQAAGASPQPQFARLDDVEEMEGDRSRQEMMHSCLVGNLPPLVPLPEWEFPAAVLTADMFDD